MPRITKLIDLNTGTTIGEWVDATGRYSCFSDARRAIAEIWDCPLSSVEEIETVGGDFLAVDAEPVAYLVSRYVPMPALSDPSVVDLRRFNTVH